MTASCLIYEQPLGCVEEEWVWLLIAEKNLATVENVFSERNEI
jgi:hypothetical protein